MVYAIAKQADVNVQMKEDENLIMDHMAPLGTRSKYDGFNQATYEAQVMWNLRLTKAAACMAHDADRVSLSSEYRSSGCRQTFSCSFVSVPSAAAGPRCPPWCSSAWAL
jgi:hypothetical protein